MIKGLTRAGIGQVGSLEHFIRQAAQYGFGAIDSSAGELAEWCASASLDEAIAVLKEENMRIGVIGLSVNWRASDLEFQEGLVRLAQDAATAAIFGVTA